MFAMRCDAMRCDAMRYNAECGKCLDLQCNDAMRCDASAESEGSDVIAGDEKNLKLAP